MSFPIEPYTCRCKNVTTSVVHRCGVAPEPGKPFVCSRCLFISVFEAPDSLRPATRKDLEQLFSQESFVRAMLRMQRGTQGAGRSA